ERDRRRIVVSLSAAAKPAVAQMRDRHAPAVVRFLSDLNDEEAALFIDQLSRLIACLNDADVGGERNGPLTNRTC
ncbi:MAG TPA: hypothetical protein VME46_26565, partial [Acidimicrobiales bacterium]|nr:hypothetical protein [Acidimicrobiales bacterium]